MIKERIAFLEDKCLHMVDVTHGACGFYGKVRCVDCHIHKGFVKIVGLPMGEFVK